MADLRLKGQEISVRVVDDGQVNDTFDSIGNLNEQVKIKMLQDGFLGEYVDRFDNSLEGFGGGFEMQLTTARWLTFQQAVIDKAQRVTPNRVFNVVVTDLYANGDNSVVVYSDVTFGEIPKDVGSRTDFAKVKWSFSTSQRGVKINALP